LKFTQGTGRGCGSWHGSETESEFGLNREFAFAFAFELELEFKLELEFEIEFALEFELELEWKESFLIESFLRSSSQGKTCMLPAAASSLPTLSNPSFPFKSKFKPKSKSCA
jgi:hypothetical protein